MHFLVLIEERGTWTNHLDKVSDKLQAGADGPRSAAIAAARSVSSDYRDDQSSG